MEENKYQWIREVQKRRGLKREEKAVNDCLVEIPANSLPLSIPTSACHSLTSLTSEYSQYLEKDISLTRYVLLGCTTPNPNAQ